MQQNKRIACLLLLALINLTFSCARHFNNFSVTLSPDHEDSLTLEDFKYKIIKEWFRDYPTLSGIDINNIPRETIDSILTHDKFETFTKQQVIYFPDKKAKIYVIETEGCGAHCNPNYYSWIQFGGQKRLVAVTNFSTVDSIYKLPGGKYLVMQTAWYDKGIIKAADLISLSSDSISIQLIMYKNNDGLKIFQENGFMTDEKFAPYIKYRKKDKILSYAYREFGYVNNTITDFLIAGNYKYIKGSFILQNEKISR